MTTTKNGFTITHIIPEEVPNPGSFRPLLFLTQSPEDKEKCVYRRGLDKNTLSAEEIENGVAKQQYIALPKPFECQYGQRLWLDGNANVICTNSHNPTAGTRTYVFCAAMLKPKPKRFITHYFAEATPMRGFRKMTYLTKEEGYDDLYLGTDNNPLEEGFLQSQQSDPRKQRIVELIKPVELKEIQTLWVDRHGALYLADREKGETDKGKTYVQTIE